MLNKYPFLSEWTSGVAKAAASALARHLYSLLRALNRLCASALHFCCSEQAHAMHCAYSKPSQPVNDLTCATAAAPVLNFNNSPVPEYHDNLMPPFL